MTDFTQLAGLITTIVGTGVGTVFLQIYRENRNHRWEEEKRLQQKAEDREERERVARELAEKLDRETRAADRTRAEIKQGIVDVAVKADAAYNEANHVNQKFDKVHERLTDMSTQMVQQAAGPMKVEVVNAPLPVQIAERTRL